MVLRTLFGVAVSTSVGCSPQPAAVIQPAMVFPMIVVFPGQQLVIWDDATQFKTMHTNILNNPSLGNPVLIDGTGGVFDVTGMKSTKSGAWAMMNPVAMSPIEFTLKPHVASGIAAARELVAGCKYLGESSDDAEAKREKIRQAVDLPAVVVLLRS